MNIAPGFVIEDDAVMCPRYREAVDIRKLKQALAHGIKKSRQYEKPTDVMVQSTLEMLRSNALLCNAYLREFPHDYLVLIRLRGTMSGYQIGKIGSQIKVDLIDNAELVAPHAGLVATTRLEYLRASLMTKYGSEILFVGSGVVMDIRSRADAENNLQSEFRVVVERHELAPIPPKRMLTGSMATLKNLAKAILGRKAPLNLYDLVTWTRWKS